MLFLDLEKSINLVLNEIRGLSVEGSEVPLFEIDLDKFGGGIDLFGNLMGFKNLLRKKLREEKIEVFFTFKNLKYYLNFHTVQKGNIPECFFLIRGEIIEAGFIKNQPLFYTAFCSSCNHENRRENLNLVKNNITENFQCNGCKSPTSSSNIVDVKVLEVQGVVIELEEKESPPLKIVCLGELPQGIETGGKIKAKGELMMYKEKKAAIDQDFNFYFLTKNIEYFSESRTDISLNDVLENYFMDLDLTLGEKIAILSCFIDFSLIFAELRSRQHLLIMSNDEETKDLFLKDIAALTKRSYRVEGPLTSAAGLASAQDKEYVMFGNRGLLNKAHGGIVLINDLELMSPEVLRVLYSPMEEGAVYYSKAGKKSRNKANISVVATVHSEENTPGWLKIPTPLASRFDFFLDLNPRKYRKKKQLQENYEIFSVLKEKSFVLTSEIKERLYEFIIQDSDFYRLVTSKIFSGARVIGSIIRYAIAFNMLKGEREDLDLLKEGVSTYFTEQSDRSEKTFENKNLSKETVGLLVLRELTSLFNEKKFTFLPTDLFIRLPDIQKRTILESLHNFFNKGVILKEEGLLRIVQNPVTFFSTFYLESDA